MTQLLAKDAEDQDSYLQPKSGKRGVATCSSTSSRGDLTIELSAALGKGSLSQKIFCSFLVQSRENIKIVEVFKEPAKSPFSQLTHQETVQGFELCGFFNPKLKIDINIRISAGRTQIPQENFGKNSVPYISYPRQAD